jgi:hypothetical protein
MTLEECNRAIMGLTASMLIICRSLIDGGPEQEEYKKSLPDIDRRLEVLLTTIEEIFKGGEENETD